MTAALDVALRRPLLHPFERRGGANAERPAREFLRQALQHDQRGVAVPEVLLSGNHAAIAAWRQQEAEQLTKERRPDLWAAFMATESRDGGTKS